ncbi:MAG: hypothetical protein ACREUZ_22830, partial [Burkholderiales bacterium]
MSLNTLQEQTIMETAAFPSPKSIGSICNQSILQTALRRKEEKRHFTGIPIWSLHLPLKGGGR